MRRVLCVVALVAAVACSEPLEFADWIIDVPEGTPIREYPPVPDSERDPDAIRLIEELIIGADVNDPDAGVFRPTAVAATEDGTIFVADSAATRVQMFDRNGRYLKTLGRKGQGPGEFQSLDRMTIAGDLLVIDDGSNYRFSIWTLDGEHVRDYLTETTVAQSARDAQGLADGTIVVRSSIARSNETIETVSQLSLDGREISRLDEMVPAPRLIPDPSWTRADITGAFINLFDNPRRSFVVGARARVYVSPMYEYQALAMSPDGIALWALRVAWGRPALSAGLKEDVVARAQTMDSGITARDFDWPSGYSAIAHLLADGAGRLYVIPDVFFDDVPPQQVPADVYSTDGEFVVGGYIPVRWAEPPAYFLAPWTYAAGDYVYGMMEDETGETVAVRYRLVVDVS